ncbi:threonine/serine dehydratase [Pendulispora albinea]|uniref:Pyridoxal-phosphate dependent enzyme n=1 Tax=Pendulispora albinea TaxID=2741071 RepID=A0ABZ2M8T3_9BACT
MRIPTFTDALQARRVLHDRLTPTPMWSYPGLDAVLGANVHVKHENVQPVGAFKVRGGITLLSSMSEEHRRRGVVSYSTGNHAQSVAYAARIFGVPCCIVMPERANPEKVRAVRALGSDVVLEGATVDECSSVAVRVAGERGMRLVQPDEPELIAGVSTCYMEIFERVPDLDAVVVPVGSGTGAAAACLMAAAMAPRCRVIAVQSEASPAGHESFRQGKCVSHSNRTVAEGLATGRGFVLPQEIVRGKLSDFLLVSDAAIRSAQRLMMTHAHTMAEGAGAAAVAAVLARPDLFADRKIAVVCSGGNASAAEMAEVLVAPSPAESAKKRAVAVEGGLSAEMRVEHA